jgi:hypothetical protein
MKFLLLALVLMSAVACNGGGGGSGGSSSSPVTGSAVFENFTTMSSQNNVCRNYSQPTEQTTCTSMGGSWNNSRTVVATSAGSYDDFTYAMTCGSGTATPICTVNGVAFSRAGLNSSAIYACTANGGAVSVLCTNSSGSEMVDNCTGATPADSSECSSLGGTFYATLHNATGSITSPNIVAGSNTIQTLIDVNVDVVDVMSLSPQNPVYLTFTVKLKDFSGITFWQSAQVRNTGADFESTGYYENFAVTSPVATSATSNGSVVIESATLFFK